MSLVQFLSVFQYFLFMDLLQELTAKHFAWDGQPMLNEVICIWKGFQTPFVVGIDVLGLLTPVLRGVTWVFNMMYTSEEMQSLSSGPWICLCLINGDKWWLSHEFFWTTVYVIKKPPFLSDLKVKNLQICPASLMLETRLYIYRGSY